MEIFLQSLPFFQDLSQNDIQALLSVSKIKTYPRKSSVYVQGDPADRFFIIISGWVKLHKSTMEGNESVLALFTRADSFGEAILIYDASYPQSAESVEEAKIIELPKAALRSMAVKNLEFSLRIMESMTYHIQRLQLENEHLAVMSTAQRVGCFLLQLCLGMDKYNGHLVFPYDKHLAAVRLGMKPETFSRALKDLQKIGVHIKKDDIHIGDIEALKKYCCSNCSSSFDNCLLAKRNSCGGCNKKKAVSSYLATRSYPDNREVHLPLDA